MNLSDNCFLGNSRWKPLGAVCPQADGVTQGNEYQLLALSSSKMENRALEKDVSRYSPKNETRPKQLAVPKKNVCIYIYIYIYILVCPFFLYVPFSVLFTWLWMFSKAVKELVQGIQTDLAQLKRDGLADVLASWLLNEAANGGQPAGLDASREHDQKWGCLKKREKKKLVLFGLLNDVKSLLNAFKSRGRNCYVCSLHQKK